MSSSKREKEVSAADIEDGVNEKRLVECTKPSTSTDTSKMNETSDTKPAGVNPLLHSPKLSAQDRLARFNALQARNHISRNQNMKDAAAEAHRQQTDVSTLKTLGRKHATASHKLLKADTEAAGEDFERKRAWDWTVDEAERWDRRMEKKNRHRQDLAFQDYRSEARKTYKRQLRELERSELLEVYEKRKLEDLERAIMSGDVELVEQEDGELVAVDRAGMMLVGPEGFVNSYPDKAGVDRLVDDIKKKDEVRTKKAKNRKNEDEPDVTYINEKNKQFNQKLARFYNKYTVDIRESFERGTAI